MIVWINGSMNAGKTTVAQILKKEIPQVAHIEKLRQFVEWMSIEQSIPLNMKNIASLTRNFVESGLNVIISYPVSAENFLLVQDMLSDLDQPIQLFTLSPRLELVTMDRGDRVLESWEIETIKESYRVGLHRPDIGVIIDNSDQTPRETARHILSSLDKQGAKPET